MGGLPASEKKYSINEFKNMIDAYKNYQKKELQENLIDFVKEIIPVAEECKVNMTLHPDDPPVALFGIPKIASNLKDYKLSLIHI